HWARRPAAAAVDRSCADSRRCSGRAAARSAHGGGARNLARRDRAASTDLIGTTGARTAVWVNLNLRRPIVPGGTRGRPSAIYSSARRPCASRARDTYQVSKMSSQGVLRLLPLLTAHSTWQHLQSLEEKERSPSREASS